MEHSTLRAVLTTEASPLLPAERALEILGAVCDVLFPMHAGGRGYGVLGPASVMVDGDRVTLLDSPVFEAEYAAPELRDGGGPSPAGDAYAYATLAHVLLAGDLPTFDEHGAVVPIAQLHPGFPAFAAEALARALQPDAAARPLPKVLFTLLRVVPIGRWPATASSPAPSPTVAGPIEPIGEQTAEPTGERSPWQRVVETEHEVPRIDWTPEEQTEHEVPQIDWTPEATPDPLSIPRIEWQAGGEPAALAPEEPDVSWWLERVTPRAEPGRVEVADTSGPGFLHDFVESLRPAADVPAIEPLAESIPEEAVAHRAGRRVRRKHHEGSPDRTQKIVLVLILLVLIAVGVVWALTHRDSPKYDPQLQGASRSLVHASPSART